MPKKIKTSLLNIAYEEEGEMDAPVIVLLHGFPDDAKTWKQVSDLLVKKGFRTLAPYHRGYGNTSFLSADTMRSAQYTALVADVIAFTEALQVKDFILVGHDWGATVACQLAALYPAKVKALVTLATSYNGTAPPQLSLQQIQAFWYQWHFNTEHGLAELHKKRHEFCHHLWRAWSPTWSFKDNEFNSTALSWNNPDFVDIVIHSYKHRWKNTTSDPQYQQLEHQLKQKPEVNVPVIFLQGDKDCASLPASSLNKEQYFGNHYERRIVSGAGHFIQRENPKKVVQAIEDVVSIAENRYGKKSLYIFK